MSSTSISIYGTMDSVEDITTTETDCTWTNLVQVLENPSLGTVTDISSQNHREALATKHCVDVFRKQSGRCHKPISDARYLAGFDQ
ncbi:hypothetical protein MHYP_G00084750 [Metynnis hypsauchen]